MLRVSPAGLKSLSSLAIQSSRCWASHYRLPRKKSGVICLGLFLAAIQVPGVAVATRPEYFFVAFDKNDYVSAWGVLMGKRRLLGFNLSRNMRGPGRKTKDWRYLNPRRDLLRGNVPQRQAVVYIYRPSGFAFPFRADPAVLVDGKLEAELRKGTYIAVPLSVGKHVISVDPLPHYNGSVPPEQRPVRSISLDTAPNTKYFVSFRVGSIGFETELMIQSEQEAMPVLENMTRAK